ncbi:MAG TPA: S9 family peptidase, partial [Kofleriaceae bacterium]
DHVADDYRSSICVVALDGTTRELVPATSTNSYPRWSPDGHELAFLSSREGSTALYVMSRDGGEARRVKGFDRAVVALAWRPDGAAILATVLVNHEPDRPAHAPRHITRQRYKSDSSGDLTTSTTRLYWIKLADGSTTEPTGADQEVMGAAVSPDGRRIAYARSRTGPRDSHEADIWMVDADGSNARRLTHRVPSASSPAWSPDGKYIVFTGNEEPGNSMSRLWLLDLERGGDAEPLGDDRVDITSYPLTRARAPLWTPEGKRVLYVSAREGTSDIGAVEIATRERERVVGGDGQIVAFHGAAETLAMVTVSIQSPGDIKITTMRGGSPRQLTHLNAWWHERVAIRAERVELGDDVAGWLISGPDTPSPAPLFVDVHGGPQSFAELGFPYHVYWWVLCSRGWRVLALNPCGSSSYGPEHARSLRSRWGELDLPQQLAAVDELVRRHIADDRIAIGGKSYGGYLAAWAIGHTQRFRAAIVSAPVTNLESHAGTSDSGYYVDAYDLEGPVHERHELARRLSPVQYAHLATTPTLILQGEDDERCPAGQSEELFAILMRVGKAPVEMVLYPRGHHDLAEAGRPSHRIDYHRRIVDWLERWGRT